MPELDLKFAKDLFPLGVDVVGDEVMFSPVGVPALDEAKNRVGESV